MTSAEEPKAEERASQPSVARRQGKGISRRRACAGCLIFTIAIVVLSCIGLGCLIVRARRAEECFRAGKSCYLTQDYDRAVQEFGKAVEIKSDFVNAYLWKGITHWARQENRAAIEAFSLAIYHDGEHCEAHVRRASCRYQENDERRAMDDLDDAVRLNPDHPLAYVVRGSIHVRQKRADQAMSDVEKAIQLDPDCADAYYWRGMVYLQRNDPERAESDFLKVGTLRCGPTIRRGAEEELAKLRKK